ncbi:ATP-binding protein [Flagellimonas lutimaris]|uniref:ATP-binding protein n=1 Tax=Flagellimonas lutimaris TaxID=475082 RepID=UPI003F5CEC56
MKKELKFKVSAALKDIIGKDLITDDFIAVFELVKNSFDAYADQVDIYFNDIYGNNPKIIIKDNGKGMSLDDIKSKWLFVAYSAKKDGTEDEGFDYRDRIYVKRAFAGAKGIGRFSCDRLGKTLMLESTKKNGRTEMLFTEWEKFEEDTKRNFIDISVLHETKSISAYGLSHGTVLEIGDLRSDWNRKKLLKLKDSIAKLINPRISDEADNEFKVYIHCKEEEQEDSKSDEYYEKVNGEVRNFIFDTLGLKTTKITSRIDRNGDYITTSLSDGGTLVYKVKEKNNFPLLKSIDITIYYLNQSAKLTFARRMGVPVINYGHIFLYKNGFRIYPYGEPGEDPLKIDRRKSQGYSRYLGTREVMGQINILEDSEELKETSSRGDGLIKTKTYESLEEFFWNTLRRLERYVVDVQKWGLSIEDTDVDIQDMRTRITSLIAQLSGSDNIVDFEYSENVLSLIEKNQSSSAETLVSNLNRIASRSGDEDLIKQTKLAAKKLKELQKARVFAEKEADEQRNIAEKTEKELDQKESENLFLKSIKSQEFEEVVSFLHHIGISSKNIDNNLKLLVKRIRKGKEISNVELVEIIQKVIFENRKILSISKFASKANFQLYTSSIEIDVVEYITEYIQNILGLVSSQKPIVHINNKTEVKFIKELKPIELNIIIDNLISNSRRAKAENIFISFKIVDGNLNINFADDGSGIKDDIAKNIFNFGFTTTSGSGIGLYHVKKMLNEMGGDITLNKASKKPTEFNLIIKE